MFLDYSQNNFKVMVWMVESISCINNDTYKKVVMHESIWDMSNIAISVDASLVTNVHPYIIDCMFWVSYNKLMLIIYPFLTEFSEGVDHLWLTSHNKVFLKKHRFEILGNAVMNIPPSTVKIIIETCTLFDQYWHGDRRGVPLL